MLDKNQIKLVQIAVKTAGIRSPKCDGRYRLMLRQYKQSNGSPVTSCKQLNNWQLDDLLAICESLGWRHPKKTEDFYRKKISDHGIVASFAQISAIKKLAGDLGWNDRNLEGFIEKMTHGGTNSTIDLPPEEAFNIIEALKSMFSRQAGKDYKNLKEIQSDMEVENDQEKHSSKVG